MIKWNKSQGNKTESEDERFLITRRVSQRKATKGKSIITLLDRHTERENIGLPSVKKAKEIAEVWARRDTRLVKPENVPA